MVAIKTVNLLSMKNVVNKKTEWIWKDWLALQKLTMVAGEAGVGKTTACLDIAAIFTRGGIFPDGQKCESTGSVLIYSTEDEVCTTLNPRLTANGANTDKIFYIDDTMLSTGKKILFDPTKDFLLLEEKLKENPDIKLIIIDPIVCVIDGDMHKANEVRKSLTPLVKLAEDYNCAILGITHFSKGGVNNNFVDKVIGSQAFVAFARMLWVVINQGDINFLSKAKSNISSLKGVCSYNIKKVLIDNEQIETTTVEWLDYKDNDLLTVLNNIEKEVPDDSLFELDKAKNIILDRLKSGEMVISKMLDKYCTDKEISMSTLNRARNALKKEGKIESIKLSNSWGWKLKSE